MENKPELIIEIGAEGGSFSAYRVKQENGTYSFYFGTNEMGLDDEDFGISTHSVNYSTDFNTFLEKIRTKYPEIYNLHPLFIHPDYSTSVLYDLRFRMKNSHFDFRQWTIVLFRLNSGAEYNYYQEQENDRSAEKIKKHIERLDRINLDIKEPDLIVKELGRVIQTEKDIYSQYLYGFDKKMSIEDKISELGKKYNLSIDEIRNILEIQRNEQSLED